QRLRPPDAGAGGGAQRTGGPQARRARQGHPHEVARHDGGGGLCAPAQDGDEPEPQDRRDRPEPRDRRGAARTGRRGMSEAPHEIAAGFMPLLDSALVVAAHEKGFAEAEGVALKLVRETSWANIRDRLAVGHFQVAHVLAPMPIACNLGLTPLAARSVVPMALGLGGNAVTVSNALWQAMAGHGAVPDLGPRAAGEALRAVVRERGRQGPPP